MASVSRNLPHQHPSVIASVLLVAAGLLSAYPFFWLILGAFKTNNEIFHPLVLWPASLDTNYYRQLFNGQWIPFFRVFGNSVVVSLLVAAGGVFLSSMAGYVFARHRLPGHRWLFLVAVVVIVVPRQALAIPLFTWLNTLDTTLLGWIGSDSRLFMDQLAGVILPAMVSGLGILYFTQVFRQVPDDLISAARLEGASEFQVYWNLLPLVRSSLLSFGLILFILSWHEHLIPLLVLSSAEKQTLPLALAGLYGSSLRFPYAVLMAASSLMILPTFLLFALLYRRLKSSLSELLMH